MRELVAAIFGQSLEETMLYEQTRSDRKVPKVVEQCVEFLRLNGLDIEGLFRWLFLVIIIKLILKFVYTWHNASLLSFSVSTFIP